MKRSARWMLASLLVTLPALGHADELEVPPYTACVELSDRPVVGSVVALSGPVSIASPNCPPVPAVCGTALHAGQILASGSDAQVALLVGGRYVQVGAESRITASADQTGATHIEVEQGSARVIEVASEPGPDLVVATPTLETRDPGADVVASVTADGASSICSYADPIQVVEGDRATPVPAGSCAGAATGAAPPEVASIDAGPGGGAALPISIADVGRCDVAAGANPPTNVASGPPGSPLPPTSPPLPPVTYCQGGACLPTPPPTPPTPPAVCCPAGIGEQPVVFEPPPD